MRCCPTQVPKILMPAMSFFLGVIMEDEQDSDDEETKVKQHAPSRHHRKTKKILRKADTVVAKLKKIRNKEEATHDMFPAIQLLHDPQGLAEALLRKLKAVSSGWCWVVPALTAWD